MEKFKKFFLWSYATKVDVSIWAMVLTVLVGFFGWICGENAVRFIVIIEILLPSTLLSFSFRYLFKYDKIQKVFTARSFIWVSFNTALLAICSIILDWIANTALQVIFLLLMIVGMYTLVLGEKWKREQ